MELALVLSSLAGAATAATINKLPKGKNKMPLIGANSHIRAQIDSLRIEKEILQKTISRLYGDPTTLTKVQVDKLLSKYQYQLGVILAKIEKLEQASKYPDLGPLGSSLRTRSPSKAGPWRTGIGISTVRILTPQPSPTGFPQIAANNRIDELGFAKLQKLGFPPSDLCSDEVFLRRAYLDVIGCLPKPDEARAFAADPDPAKGPN